MLHPGHSLSGAWQKCSKKSIGTISGALKELEEKGYIERQKTRASENPETLDFTGDRERIRTAGLPLRSVQRTTKNIERTAFLGYSFIS